MNEFPVQSEVEFPVQSKGLWDRRGANITSCRKKMYGGKLFRGPKNYFGERSKLFFYPVLSETDLGNVDMWLVQVFV